jgi:hypothetical protein
MQSAAALLKRGMVLYRLLHAKLFGPGIQAFELFHGGT